MGRRSPVKIIMVIVGGSPLYRVYMNLQGWGAGGVGGGDQTLILAVIQMPQTIN